MVPWEVTELEQQLGEALLALNQVCTRSWIQLATSLCIISCSRCRQHSRTTMTWRLLHNSLRTAAVGARHQLPLLPQARWGWGLG